MPSKSRITASACVLFDRPVAFSQIEHALGTDYEVVKTVEEPTTEWYFGGPTVVVAFRPEVNGYAMVDLVEQPWPDSMGDPVKEQMLFAAWSMGQFGPYAFPKGLERASEQSWVWVGGKEVVAKHTNFLRVRTSYALGLGEDGKLFPDDYDPLAELLFVSQLTVKLMNLPQTFGYYNPNGEVLRGRAEAKEILKVAAREELPPIELWVNVRLFNIDANWILMDTLGHSQFDALGKAPFPDVEMLFPKGSVRPDEVDTFLRNMTHYLLQNGSDSVKDGDTFEGPGGKNWQIATRKQGICMSPRPTLRLWPIGETVPEPYETMGNTA